MFQTKLQVRYSETDQMGIVHHSRYFPWFEVGRTEFFKQSGYSYAQMERQGVLLPLVDCACKFIHGARYGDEVWVTVCLEKLGVAKCRFVYQVFRVEDGLLLAVGSTTHGFTDRALKPLNLKKTHPELYQNLSNLQGGTE